MSEHTLGPKSVKRASKELQAVLSEVGITANLGHCREAVSKLLDRKNWDTLLGMHGEVSQSDVQLKIGPYCANIAFHYRYNADFDDVRRDEFSRVFTATFTRNDLEKLLALRKSITCKNASARMAASVYIGEEDVFEDLNINIDANDMVWLDAANGVECLSVELGRLLENSMEPDFYFAPTGAGLVPLPMKAGTAHEAREEAADWSGKILTADEFEQREKVEKESFERAKAEGKTSFFFVQTADFEQDTIPLLADNLEEAHVEALSRDFGPGYVTEISQVSDLFDEDDGETEEQGKAIKLDGFRHREIWEEDIAIFLKDARARLSVSDNIDLLEKILYWLDNCFDEIYAQVIYDEENLFSERHDAMTKAIREHQYDVNDLGDMLWNVFGVQLDYQGDGKWIVDSSEAQITL